MAKKKRKTKREKIAQALKQKQLKKQAKKDILAQEKTPHQEANSGQLLRKTYLGRKKEKADYSGLFNQTKLIQKDLLKSIALSLFILASEFVLYWRLK